MRQAWVLGLCCWLQLVTGLPGADRPHAPPNIIFIFADDWGWGDLSCHGHSYLKTPHLDRLAAEGIDFQQFTVSNPVCSPSRTSVITGHFPARYSIHQHFAAPWMNADRGMPDWLDSQAPSLPRFLKQAGYRTGHFGKWHLTNRNTHAAPTPDAYGYDEAKVFNGGAEWPSAGVHDAGDDAVAFIRAHADKRFFLNVWLHESHLPHVPSKAAMERWKDLDERKRVYAAVITDGDEAVGKILNALSEKGIDGNTLVLFSSDNGPEWTSSTSKGMNQDPDAGIQGYDGFYSLGETGGLRGRKRSLFEGGVRVPFLVRWPQQIPAGVKDDETVIASVDLLPTLCAAAHVSLPSSYVGDGENLLPALLGRPMRRSRPIYWQWNGNATEPDWWPRLAVRDGDWKLLMNDDASRVELHDLSRDRQEAQDLSSSHPEVVSRLVKLSMAWKETLPASPADHCINVEDRKQRPTPSKKKPGRKN